MHYLICAALAVSATPAVADNAAIFAARPAATRMALSPTGTKTVYTTAYKTRGRAIMVADLTTGDASVVLASSGVDITPAGCSFKTETRLICNLYGTVNQGATTRNFSRVIAVDVDGKNIKVLSQRANDRNVASAYGGGVLDYMPDDPRHVLMMINTGEAFGGEIYGGGTNIKRAEPGLGAALVDISTGQQTIVERTSPRTETLGSDQRGAVRFRGTAEHDADGYVRDAISYSVRPKGSREWQPLGRAALSDYRAIDYVGFDEAGDNVLELKDYDGRKALFAVAVGTNTPALIYANPEVDVDGVLRIGKYRRAVAATYTVDRDEYHFFDAKLAALGTALTKALPGHPDVSVLDESWDGTKKLIYADASNGPGKYYLYDATTKKLGPLASVYPQLDGIALGSVRSVKYTARDGTKIPGYLTLPPGRTDARGLPAIVMPHGGPSARDSAGFDWLAQFFAAEGYAVLQPNFRGSTGYGEAFFAQNGFKSWALAMGDVNDGARWLLAQGADARKLAIVGWSYGGYAALQANVVEPGLYHAIIAIAPVTDLALFRTEAQRFSNFKIVDAIIGNGPHVLAGSPARNAAQMTAPVLMFHPERDLNVEIEQSRVMASALRGAGKSVELVEYKGLDHQIDDSDVRASMLTRSAAFLKASLN